jgi:transcriptional regulator with XRE-family HTH domain
MAKSKPKQTLTEAMRTAIEQSGLTRYRIAADTGILETSISRFMDGKTSLRLDKADVLARYLGLQLTADPDAEPPRPTPENLARPMLTKPTAKRQRKAK